MKVADRLARRWVSWRELEDMCSAFESIGSGKLGPLERMRFAALYRSACADLALADSYQLPANTVKYLHQLVGRAHNQLYRAKRFNVRAWGPLLFRELPQLLFHDPCLRAAFVIFWGLFLGSAFLAASDPEFAQAMLGNETKQEMEEMYSQPFSSIDVDERTAAVGGYIRHNAGIGIQCFAGCVVVVGVVVLVFNACFLGAVFGYMSTVPQKENFFNFVTAHGPFELTAVVLMAGAGLRLGYSLVYTRGLTRAGSVAKVAPTALAMAMVGVTFFCIAAFIEGLISPSPLPYWVKATVAAMSSLALVVYFVVLGAGRSTSDAA